MLLARAALYRDRIERNGKVPEKRRVDMTAPDLELEQPHASRSGAS
jgi:hypothetical protein